MDTKTTDLPSFEEATQPGPESTDPGYLAWRDAKVRKALEASKAHPERSIPAHEVWKKFGLES